MAQPQPVQRPMQQYNDAQPDWADIYYTPTPANRTDAPAEPMSALEQMYAYFDG